MYCMKYELAQMLASRDNTVGQKPIMRMAMQGGFFKPTKGYGVCDIDDTLADIAPRRQFLTTDPQA